MTAGNGRSVTYTSFNMVKSVTQNGNTISFTYDPDHNRAGQVNPQVDTVYLPATDVTSGNAGATEEIHTYFQDTSGQNVGQLDRTGVTSGSAGTVVAKFFVNDWQSSVTAITSSTGSVVEGDSYDAWGKRRNLDGSPDPNDTITSQTIHGYTNQEHLQDAHLIDLNARMYNPLLGVMLSSGKESKCRNGLLGWLMGEG